MATPFDSIGGLLGIDPEQLKQLMAALGPQEEDRKAANMQALTQLGLGLLGTRKGYEWEQLGNAGQNALMARQQAMQGAQAGRMDQVKMAEQFAKIAGDQNARKAAEAMNQRLASADMYGGGDGEGDAPPQKAQRAYDVAMRKWQIAIDSGDVKRAEGYLKAAESVRVKYGLDPKVVMKDGKAVLVQTSDTGDVKEHTGYAPKPEYVGIGTGKEHVLFDPLSQTYGGRFAMQTTPGQDLQHREWQADYGLRKLASDRAGAPGSGPKAPEGYRWTADGKSMEFIPGGPQDPSKVKAEKPSDEQLKTGGFVERMQFADKYISAIENDTLKPGTNVVAKEGYKPGVGEGFVQGFSGIPLVGGGLGRAASIVQGWVEPRAPQYKTAKKAWIRAKLRKESGAVIGAEEEADEDRTFFPQTGDPAEVVAQKAALRKNTEQSMAKQARGGYQGGAVQDDPLGLRR